MTDQALIEMVTSYTKIMVLGMLLGSIAGYLSGFLCGYISCLFITSRKVEKK